MANLTETSAFNESVYQIETTDPVLGGPGGIANTQAQALANRTRYLKDQIEIVTPLASNAQPKDTLLSALAALSTVADRVLYFTGSDTVALATLTAYARTLLATTDASAARTALGVDAAINSAVAAIVASSPAALDTLNELAAALGNDANFATTMTNALALKAPLASPTLTGNPTAPTPAQFDNDTSIATTAFVRRNGLMSAGIAEYSTNSTLTVADAGKIIRVTGAITLTLPAASAVQSGTMLWFINANAGTNYTIQRAGSDIIHTGANLTSIVVGDGDSIVLVCTGAGSWAVQGGIAQAKYSGQFGALLSGNGYQKLPSGLILQWGTVDTSSPSYWGVTFPIAFPNACLNVTATDKSSSVVECDIMGVGTVSKTGVGIYGSTNADNGATMMFFWFAIGY